jgi:hypothetical protein
VNLRNELENRINSRQKRSLLDINTRLEHFAIISYKVPVDRIQHLIPKPFKLWTFFENEIEYALISAVPFKDKDFSLYRILKFIKFSFYQTNFRTYIVNQNNNTHCAWFFGTTLGSLTSIIPKRIWKMPWEYGQYKTNFTFENNFYANYQIDFKSKHGNGNIRIKSKNKKMILHNGFKSLDEQILILTHPVIGYYNLIDNKIGTYEIWHPKIDLYEGKSEKTYFEIFEKLGFLSKKEMDNPHSILMTNEIEFDILMPPKKMKNSC